MPVYIIQHPYVVDSHHVLRIINQRPQFTLSSWGRLIHEDIMSTCDWLTAALACKKKKKVWWCGFSRSLAQLAQAISSSTISSDVLLSDGAIVFVLDIVLALIINCSNYSAPYPSLWKQCVEQEKPARTQEQTQRPTVRGSTGERINSLIKCSLYVFPFTMHFAAQLPVCSHLAVGHLSPDVLTKQGVL